MSAPLIWIIFPAFFAVLLFALNPWRRVSLVVGSVFSLWLAWAAWMLPFGEALVIGENSLKISEVFTVMGRDFILSEAERPFVAMLYLINFLWLIGAFFAQPGNMFAPFSVAMIALLTAVLAVEPFLYAALFIEMIALLAVPMLVRPGQSSRRGVLRFLAFQTFGMPFILLTGWMLAGTEASPGDLEFVLRAGILLGVGFAFLLAVFPFHSWIPMLAEEAHPYIAAFLFFMLPGVVSLFMLGFLNRFVWLRESESIYLLLRTIGMLMVLVGGIWAAFEDHLGRIMGYAAVMEIGLTLMAIGLGTVAGIRIFFWLLLPRAVAFLGWALSLARLYRETEEQVRFSQVQGLGRAFLLTNIGLLIAHFSLAGVPLFAGFPVRLALWENLAVDYPLIAGGAILGNIGLLVAGLRTLAVLFASPQENDSGEVQPGDETQESTVDVSLRPRFILAWGLFLLFVGSIVYVGLLPQKYLPFINLLMGMFDQLGG